MSKSKRKFYRSVIQIEVLSEEPYSTTDLEVILDDITNGHQVGGITLTTDSEIMDVKTCVEKLISVGSDPDFFSLTIHGHDTEDIFEDDNEEDQAPVIKKMK